MEIRNEGLFPLSELRQDNLNGILELHHNKLKKKGILSDKDTIENLVDEVLLNSKKWISIEDLPLPKEIDFIKNLSAASYREYPDYVEWTNERFYCYALLMKLPLPVMMMIYTNCPDLSLDYLKQTYIRGVLFSAAKKRKITAQQLSVNIKEANFGKSKVSNIFNGTQIPSYQDFIILARHLNISEDTITACGLCFGSTESFHAGAVCEEYFSSWLGKAKTAEELEEILAEQDEDVKDMEMKLDVYEEIENNDVLNSFRDFTNNLGVSVRSINNFDCTKESNAKVPEAFQMFFNNHFLECSMPNGSVINMQLSEFEELVKDVADYIQFRMEKHQKSSGMRLSDKVQVSQFARGVTDPGLGVSEEVLAQMREWEQKTLEQEPIIQETAELPEQIHDEMRQLKKKVDPEPDKYDPDQKPLPF